jgi:hypothetical protein
MTGMGGLGLLGATLPVPCEKPAHLVVISTITDPVKITAYREALRESGLYPALGGFYITSGRPVSRP